MINSFEIIKNNVLIVSAMAWLVAGVLKVIIEIIVLKKIDLKRIFGAGGMPSSHTATVVALVISTGYYAGLSSNVFAVTVILAIIVVHDAMGVRRETGIQAKVLNKMVFDSNINIFENLNIEKRLKEYIGHTPSQVFIGMIVGIIVSIIMINIL